MWAIIIGLIAGAASTVQASINTEARKFFRSPFLTAGLNFTMAWLLLAAFLLVTEHRLYVPLMKIAENPPWIWLGGVCAIIIVTLNITCLPHLGAAGNVMIINFGQIMTGLMIDHFALFGSEEARMSVARLAGAVLVLIGMMLVTVEKETIKDAARSGAGRKAEKNNTGAASAVLVYGFLAFICGVACSVQIAVNGTLKTVLQSVSKATLISMSVAWISTLAVIAVLTLIRSRYGLISRPRGESLFEQEQAKVKFRPWMISGGIFAVIVVSGNAAAAPVIGTGLATIMNLIGMMGGGLVIDAVGFLGIEKKPVTLRKVTGMLLMLAGTAMISFL